MPISPLPASGPMAMPTGGTGPRPQGKMVAQNEEKDVARGKFAVKLLVALLFVAVGLFGVLAYNLWFAKDETPPPVVVKPIPASARSTVAEKPAVPTTEKSPTAAVVETVSAAGQTLVGEAPKPAGPVEAENADSLVARVKAAAARDAAPLNEVLASAEPAPATAATTPPVPAPVEMKPVPPPEPVVVARPEPSAAFKSFVVNLKINGVFQGENARAMLNSKMYRLGEVVDTKLGIVFLRLEPEDKRIVFEDAKGAIMSRRY